MKQSESVTYMIEYLKSQRNGTNPGGGVFYQILEDAFLYLKDRCEKENSNFCNPYITELSYAIYKSKSKRTTMVHKTLNTLVKLGNIKIEGSGENRKIYVMKDLEF